MKGYKAFNADWTCKGKQYKVGEMFEEAGELEVCKRGIHFCENISNVFEFYPLDEAKTKVAEVEAIGKIEKSIKKCCTDKITIIREIPWGEVLKLCNSGDWNSGSWNSGSCNSGSCNSGDRNSGDWNSGDWNSGNWNSGCFCTDKNPKIMLFDKMSDWTHEDWKRSDAARILRGMPNYKLLAWIDAKEMTEEEKKEHPEYATIGGFLKTFTATKKDRQAWWNSLPDDHKNEVMSIPNFDADKFKGCTGIDVR